MSPLRWTTKSTRKLAAALTRQGHRLSADTVAGLLREEGFSLQANAKTLEGAQHPDRDAQFHYLNEQARDHRDAGDPVISVDSKKKELIGDYKNAGHEWQPAGQPVRVKTHDFPGQAEKAIPYGIYDMAVNTGWVSIGTDHDTAAFAVASIRRWWQARRPARLPRARRVLITADGGGSNGYRTRGWKTHLADLAAETGLEITVCHLPPGTSKWNKFEHRLFSHITMNWRGRPLTSHEVVIWVRLGVGVFDGVIMAVVGFRFPGGLAWAVREGVLRTVPAGDGAVGLDVAVFTPRLGLEGRFAARPTECLDRGLSARTDHGA